MNNSSHLNEFDILLYTAMPYTKNKELDIYKQADSEIKLSDKAKRKIYYRVKKERKYAERHQKFRPGWEAIKRVAVVTLLVISLGFVSLLSVEAIRDAIWRTVTQWYNESIFFAYVTDDDINVPTKILEYKEPLIGGGYKRYEIIKNEYDFSIEFENVDTLITYQQNLLDKYEVMLSNHFVVMSHLKVNDHDGKAASYTINGMKYSTIIWNDGRYVYKLEGNIELPLLVDYAESIL